MCSPVFITGLDPDFAAENVGYFTSPYAERAKVGKPVIDRAGKAVHVTMHNGVTLSAKYLGSQGCVTLPAGQSSVNFTPIPVKSSLPDPSKQPWPMGDVLPKDPLPGELDAAKVKQALDAAFEPAAEMTAAVVVTWKRRLIAERYGENITARTPLESWSMGKSVTATLMGTLVKQGVFELSQPAPIPEWQGEGDPRGKIRIADITNMSSGLRIKSPQDPDYDSSGTYRDHLYLCTGTVNSFHYAATRPLQWPAGQVGRYHNTDPVLIDYLIRHVRQHAGAGVESGQAPNLRRFLLDQWGQHVPGSEGGLLHVRCGWPDDLDHSVARSGGGAPRTLQRQHSGILRFQESTCAAHGSRSGKKMRASKCGRGSDGPNAPGCDRTRSRFA